jgi:hypothetical protein
MGEKLNLKRNEETPEQEKSRLYKELIEGGGVFRFPGIDPEQYKKMKQGDEEDIYGVMTPTDTLIDRFSIHGVRFAETKFPESGNILIIPNDSYDLAKDSILIKNLDLKGVEDPKVARLLDLCR